MIGAVLALLVVAAPVPRAMPKLTLEVQNPRSTGRHLLALEDVVGPEARALAGPGRAMLVVILTPFLRQPFGTDLAKLSALAEANPGGLVVGIVASAPPGSSEARLDPEGQRFLVLADPHGLAKQRLGVVGPGQVLVIRSDGRIVGDFSPAQGALGRAIELFSSLLKEDLP